MKGHFADLSYDLRETTKAVKEVIQKHVPNPETYLSCLHPYDTCKKMADYLAELSNEETEKHKDLIGALIKKIK